MSKMISNKGDGTGTYKCFQIGGPNGGLFFKNRVLHHSAGN